MRTIEHAAPLVRKAGQVSGRTFTFRASSTAGVRDGMKIPAGEWRLDNYRKNPVVLLGHDTRSLPIGRATRVEQDDDGLITDIVFDDFDPVAQLVEKKLAAGSLNAVSVSFRPGREEKPRGRGEPGVWRDVELLEISVVAVPADPNALMVRALLNGRTRSNYPSAERQLIAEALAMVRGMQDKQAIRQDIAQVQRMVRQLRREGVR